MDVHVGGWDPLRPDGSTGRGFRYLVHFSGSRVMFYSPCPDNLTPQELRGNMLLSSCEKNFSRGEHEENTAKALFLQYGLMEAERRDWAVFIIAFPNS